MNLNLAPAWMREMASKNGIKTGQFFVVAIPSHNKNGVFTPGKVCVWNTRKAITLTFGADLSDQIITDQDVWEMTR